MHASVKVPEVARQVQLVLAPRDAVDPRRRTRAQRPKRHRKSINGHVMQQRRQPFIPVLLRHLAHTLQIT
jgi:hypothetical protein